MEGSMAIAVWLEVPLGSITRLGPLKSHPGALPTSGKADGPNGPVKGRWLARGSSSSCEGKISGSGGGTDAMRRPVRLANMDAISVLKDEKPDSKAASLNLPGESALGEDGTSGHTFPDLFPPPPP